MTRLTRRQLLHDGAAVAAAAIVPRPMFGATSSIRPIVTSHGSREGDPDAAALAERAVQAARDAGATYADARLTLTRRQDPAVSEFEAQGFGVRALVNGYWGFMSSAVWTPDEAARLARGAAAQARASSRGRTRPVELGAPPAVRSGRWTMPVTSDPFDIPVGEKLDVLNALSADAMHEKMGIQTYAAMLFTRQCRWFASTDDASWTQTTYESSAAFTVLCRDEFHAGLDGGSASADGLSPAGRGWELVADSGVRDAIPELIEQAEQSRLRVPFEIGRYDVVCTAEAMASLLDQTLGPATELDRALGYEANASGTSYLSDPLAMLGAQRVASSLVTVTANRSQPGGLATVQWDDEGMSPDEFTLVREGVLADYQTTREQAAWLAPAYQRLGRPVRSHGCANATSALVTTMQHAPNLALAPGVGDGTFEQLVAGVSRGIAVMSCSVGMDQQSLNGMAYGVFREIRGGLLGRYIMGGAMMFRAPELWKSVVAVGGARSQRWYGYTRGKGQPGQTTSHSVGAVPAMLRQVSFVDPGRSQ